MGSKPPLDLSSCSALTLLVGSLTRKTVPDMTYNVFGGTLNLTQSITVVLQSHHRRQKYFNFASSRAKRVSKFESGF